MTLDDIWKLKDCNLPTKGSLDGATVKPISRLGDLSNKVSLGTAAVFISKSSFDEHIPYSREYDNTTGLLTIYMNYHFIKEVRRQLSVDVPAEESKFSPEEEVLYTEYAGWTDLGAGAGEHLLAFTALDKWLVDEVMDELHPVLDRTYDKTHKWRKTDERTD